MGWIKQGRDAFVADIAEAKAAGATRAQLDKYVQAIIDAGNEWMVKRTTQNVDALSGFADSRQAQFKTYTDALPDPVLGDIDPNL